MKKESTEWTKEEFDRVILPVLVECRSVSLAALRLGYSRNRLYVLMKKFDVKPMYQADCKKARED